MADTLINIVKEVLRATQQGTTITAFSDNDDTQYVVDRINDALEDIYALKPTQVDTNGTVTITASTRTFSGPAGLELERIYDWSYRLNDADGDIDLEVVTKEYIVTNFPLFETEEADRPQYIYIDNNTIAVYPLLEAGAASLTLQFSYPAQFTKLTLTTATFPFQDRSHEMRYVKMKAQMEYEIFKSLGQPAYTGQKVDALWAAIVAKYARLKRQGFRGYRRYGV